jgi:hypothetical protein
MRKKIDEAFFDCWLFYVYFERKPQPIFYQLKI